MTASALRPSHLPELELCTPTSVEELTRLVADGFCPMAGGSDVLLAALQRGEPRHLVSTVRVAELGRLDIGDREITIGGAVTLARLVRHPELRSGIAAIAEAAQKVGSVQLRNSATLIGNLCTASPAGDTIAGLFVHNAIVDTVDSSGTRRAIGVGDFLLGPGQTALVDSEIVTGV
ncbi:MAG: hypothetical protein GY773_18690, partial [Actinomycetia bacterium]|nr:hypothetical protein [Actinomycetes bacterium]